MGLVRHRQGSERAVARLRQRPARRDERAGVHEDVQRGWQTLFPADRPLAAQTAFFVPTKHLSLVDPQIQAEVTLENGRLAIDLTARSLARLVECSLTGTDVVFSDNYFDLPAQKGITVTAPLPDGWDLARASAALTVRSVYDTYAR
jgi:beta-mannosidase